MFEVTAVHYILIVSILLLLVSVYFNIKQRKKINEQDTQESALIKKAYFNPITDLPNLLNITMLIDEQMNRTVRHKRKFLVAVIKIKNYYDVNMHSSDYGKAFMIEASHRIVGALRTEDIVAHTTENGFVILFNEYLLEENYNILFERLQNSFAEKFTLNSTTTFDFDISIGTAISSDVKTTSAALINEATRQALKN